MRFTLAANRSGETVGCTFSSIRRCRRSAVDSGVGLTKPVGVADCLRNDRSSAGIGPLADGPSTIVAARAAVAERLFDGFGFFRAFFVAMCLLLERRRRVPSHAVVRRVS